MKLNEPITKSLHYQNLNRKPGDIFSDFEHKSVKITRQDDGTSENRRLERKVASKRATLVYMFIN